MLTPRAPRPVLGFWMRSLLVLLGAPLIIAWGVLRSLLMPRDEWEAWADRTGLDIRDWCIAGRGE